MPVINLSLLDILLLLLAPAVGSFLGVLALRLPAGQDVVRQASACDHCRQVLSWRDLVPLLSWLALGGKCRHCATPIPVVLPLLEAGAVFLALLAIWRMPSDVQALTGAGFLWCLLVLFVIDLTHFRLPDVLTGTVFVLGCLLAVLDPWRGLNSALIGAIAGAGSFWLIRIAYARLRGREGLGMGDVKLMAGLGAGLGAQALPLLVLLAALGALVWAGAQALRQNTSLQARTALPFGSFLCLAAGILLLGNA